MRGYSINDAMSRLGIYKSEAQALDALDGIKDGKITKDIFTLAQETLANAEAQYSENNEGEMINLTKWSNAAKAMGKTIAQKMGFAGFIHSSNPNEDLEETVNSETHEQVMKLSEEATNYIKEHKNLEGFKFTGMPKGVTKLKLNVDDYYGNSENDVVTFDAEGNAVVEKVIDGVAVDIHYRANNTDYGIGGVVENDEDESPATDESQKAPEETKTE